MSWVLGVAVVIVLGIVITIIGAKAHWWLVNYNVNHQNQVYQNSYGTQQADIQSMEDAIGGIPSAVDPAQATADTLSACKYAAKITSMPPGDASWVAVNCDGPAISQSSQYSSR